jgi:hypothetical protein
LILLPVPAAAWAIEEPWLTILPSVPFLNDKPEPALKAMSDNRCLKKVLLEFPVFIKTLLL